MGIRTTLIVLALGVLAGAFAWNYAEPRYQAFRYNVCSPLNQLLDFRPDAATRWDRALEAGDDEAALDAAWELQSLASCPGDQGPHATLLGLELAEDALEAGRPKLSLDLVYPNLEGPDPSGLLHENPGTRARVFALSPERRLQAALVRASAQAAYFEETPLSRSDAGYIQGLVFDSEPPETAEASANGAGYRLQDALETLRFGYAVLGETGFQGETRQDVLGALRGNRERIIAAAAPGALTASMPYVWQALREASPSFFDAVSVHGGPEEALAAAEQMYATFSAIPSGTAGFDDAASVETYRAFLADLAHRLIRARSNLLDGATERREAFEDAIAEALEARAHISKWAHYQDASLAIHRHQLALNEEAEADAVLVEAVNEAMRRRVDPKQASLLVATLVSRRAFVRGAPRDGVIEDLPYDLCAALDQVGSVECFDFALAYVRLAYADLTLPETRTTVAFSLAPEIIEFPCAGRFCEREAESVEVTLLFGTTREYDPTVVVPSERFGAEDDPDNRGWRGQVTVKAPAEALGAPLRYAAVSPVEDRFEPFVIETPEVFGAGEQAAARFREVLAERLDASGEDAVLVYVHGVNNSFADAARRAAQVTYDLGFEGAPAFYSWPTRRNRWIPSYFSDADFSSAPPADLAQFLRELGAEAGTIHLIAHSHGSKLLMQAAGQLRSEGLPIGEVILAAPDVDSDDLERDTRTILAPLAERVTIYSNQTDLAIGVSAILRWAGFRGRGRSDEDVDQVDATNVVPIFSHGYFAEEAEVLADIRAVLWHGGLTPAQRCYLAEIPRDADEGDDPPSWRFDIEACDVAAFETASAIAAEVRDDRSFCGPFPELFARVDPRRVRTSVELGLDLPADAAPEAALFVEDGEGGQRALADDPAFLAARTLYADVFGGDPNHEACAATARAPASVNARG